MQNNLKEIVLNQKLKKEELLTLSYFELRNPTSRLFHTHTKQPQDFLSQEQKFNFSL
jgi:hypothetical protein